MACGPLSEEKKATKEVQDICDEVCSYCVTKILTSLTTQSAGREVLK